MRRPAGVALLLVLAAAGCGGDPQGRSPAPGGADPFADVERERRRDARDVRAAPRWESLGTLRGDGGGATERRSLRVAARAIQWRARWACRAGGLRVETRGRGDARGRLLDERCPASGEATAVGTGAVEVAVTADGPWRLAIEQQVDTPLREPAPAALRDGTARRLAAGRFVSLERRARGRATLHRLPTGGLLLRLEGFVTAASADLFVWVGPRARPTDSRQALAAPHVEIGPLKATAGDQNYLLPRRLREQDVRSVVIWCEPVRIAYGAAGLRPG